jgi:hypothetical protein
MCGSYQARGNRSVNNPASAAMTAASKTMRTNFVEFRRAQRRASVQAQRRREAEAPSIPISTAHQISPRLGSFAMLTPKVAAVTLTIAIALATAGQAQADPDKAAYELSERCGKSAEQFFANSGFKAGYSKDDNINVATIAGFENHYNSHVNKCFILITSQTMDDKKTPLQVTKHWELYDVNDNRLMTSFYCLTDGDAIRDQTAPTYACAVDHIADAQGLTAHIGRSSGKYFDEMMRSYMER